MSCQSRKKSNSDFLKKQTSKTNMQRVTWSFFPFPSLSNERGKIWWIFYRETLSILIKKHSKNKFGKKLNFEQMQEKIGLKIFFCFKNWGTEREKTEKRFFSSQLSFQKIKLFFSLRKLLGKTVFLKISENQKIFGLKLF